jgi:hypothetical protein
VTHWTQRCWFAQNGVGAAHCALLEHWTQAPSLEQTGVDVPAQSVLVRHCWQREMVRLQ